MKTKLSFLALPLCLGLLLTFVFAACSDDSNDDNGGGASSNSSGPTPPPTSAGQQGNSIKFDNPPFGLDEQEGDKINLKGKVTGTSAVKIKKLEFGIKPSVSNWLYGYNPDKDKYELVSGSVTIEAVGVSLNDYYIDLTGFSPNTCGQFEVWVKAYGGEGTALDTATSPIKTFTRANSYCSGSSSSQGFQAPSSSSESGWKFGGDHAQKDISWNTSFTLGSGSIKLTGDPASETQPGLEVEKGKIVIEPISLAPVQGEISTTREYTSKELFTAGNNAASKLPDDSGIQLFYYYIIYFDGGDKYAVQFSSKTGDDNNWGAWPKKIEYWKATISPPNP